MAALVGQAFLSVEDYLAGEPLSPVRHEYIGGAVYAMAGGSRDHNRIAVNLTAALDAHARGGPCEVFVNDLKVRLLIQGQDIFYYPDVVLTCDPRDGDPFFLRFPRLIIEVLSDTTEATDRREKLLAYRTIPTLEEYVLVAQDRPEITFFRREDGWQPLVVRGADQVVTFVSVGLSLPLAEVYRRVFA
jgi:Uma2 family endonuclease